MKGYKTKHIMDNSGRYTSTNVFKGEWIEKKLTIIDKGKRMHRRGRMRGQWECEERKMRGEYSEREWGEKNNKENENNK